MKLEKCKYGGGHNCERQGGDGFTMHKSGYSHAYCDSGVSLQKGIQSGKVYTVPDLEGGMLSEKEVTKSIFFQGNDLGKSLYYFNLDEPMGVARLLELLPVLSEEIIGEVYAEIWPGYPTENSKSFNVRMARQEIRGYLLDYMVQHDFEKPTEERPRAVDSSI